MYTVDVRRKQSKAHELTHDLQLTSTSTTSTTTSTTSTLNATTTSSAGDTTITDRLLHSANDMSHNNQHQNALPLSKSPPPPAPQQHFHLSPNGHALHSSTTIATNPQADNHIVLNGNDIPLETIQLDSPAGTDQNTNNHSSEADGVVTPVPLNFWSELAFYIFFWIYKGIEVDAFYTLQGIMFGNEATAKCIIPKVIVDQFVYNPPWSIIQQTNRHNNKQNQQQKMDQNNKKAEKKKKKKRTRKLRFITQMCVLFLLAVVLFAVAGVLLLYSPVIYGKT